MKALIACIAMGLGIVTTAYSGALGYFVILGRLGGFEGRYSGGIAGAI